MDMKVFCCNLRRLHTALLFQQGTQLRHRLNRIETSILRLMIRQNKCLAKRRVLNRIASAKVKEEKRSLHHSPKHRRFHHKRRPTSSTCFPPHHTTTSLHIQNVIRLPPTSLQCLRPNSHLPKQLMPRPPNDRARANGLPHRQRARCPILPSPHNRDLAHTITKGRR